MGKRGGHKSHSKFTVMQRKALPILAAAADRKLAIEECVSRGFFHHKKVFLLWLRDPEFVKALQDAEDQIDRESVSRVCGYVRSFAQPLAETQVRRSLDDKFRETQRALETSLHVMGVDVGRARPDATKVNVAVAVMNEFKAKTDQEIEEIVKSDAALLRLIRGEAKGNGSADGNGHADVEYAEEVPGD